MLWGLISSKVGEHDARATQRRVKEHLAPTYPALLERRARLHELARDRVQNFGPNLLRCPDHAVRDHLNLAGTLQSPVILKDGGHTGTDHDQSMVSKHQNALVLEVRSETTSFVNV